jgi:uncharacterized RDD family membrane protein YckC
MTNQPPPGNYPPPPPGGYPPPPQGGGFPPPAQAPGQALPQDAYTPWFTRVVAWVIDYLPLFILLGIGGVLLATMQKVETVCITDESEFELGEFCATGNNGPSMTAWLLASLCVLVWLAFVVWNLGLRQGSTGSSVGKAIMKFKLVGDDTGAPVGFGKSLLREIVYLVVYFACGLLWLIAVVFPLFDQKRQTLVDKLFKTVCVPL